MIYSREEMEDLIIFRQLYWELFRVEAEQGLTIFYSQSMHIIAQETLRIADTVTRALLVAHIEPSPEVEKAHFHGKLSAPVRKRIQSEDFQAKGVLIANDMLAAVHVYQKLGFMPEPFYPLQPVVQKGKRQ